MFRCIFLGAICLFAAAGAWAQQQAPLTETPTPSPSAPPQLSSGVISMEEPRPGDHWTYQVRDEITGKVSRTRQNIVTEVTPKDISVRFKIVETSNEGLSVYDHSWNLLSDPNWRYSPYQSSTGIRTPLVVGKTWAFQSNSINTTNGAIWKVSGNSTIVGQETVTTKAGTFETFKIETSFSTQNVKDPTKKNQLVFQTWYAPAIDHWVKRITVVRVDKHLRSNETLELIDYGRKQ